MACLKRIYLLFFTCLALMSCVPPTRLVQDIPPTQPAAPTYTAAPIPPTPVPSPSATPEGAWIHLIPSSGAPGDVIAVEGYLPGGVAQSELDARGGYAYADMCWAGCKTGLLEGGQQVTWSKEEPGRFQTQFTVPAAPWLATDGYHALTAGEYSIDVFDLDPTKYGCANPDPNSGCPVVPQASAAFTLEKSAPAVDCTLTSCGSISVSPEKAGPGSIVHVHGWAPLLGDLNMLSYYSVALIPAGQDTVDMNIQRFMLQQSLDGSLSGSFQVPQMTPSGVPLATGSYNLYLSADGMVVEKGQTAPLINHIPFELTPALAYAEVKHGAPRWIKTSADLSNFAISVDSATPDRLAYCAPGEIRLSENSGQSWQSIPTTAVTQVRIAEGVNTGDNPPICASVLLDPAHPDSFFATFSVVSTQYGAPPVYFAGYYTTDRGQTWQTVPAPSVLVDKQVISGNFGGFWEGGSMVQALFYSATGGTQPSANPVVKQTTDGGLTWETSRLSCPASGPCLRFGMAPAQISGMGSDLPQNIIASPDGGTTWQDSGQTAELRYPAPHELVALSDREALYLAGAEPYPINYTNDGGANWQALALPPLPGGPPQWPGGYLGLQMLPDGRLLAMQSATGQWYALAPGAADWCPIRYKSADMNDMLFRQVGGRIWWLPLSTQTPVSVPESEFMCAGK